MAPSRSSSANLELRVVSRSTERVFHSLRFALVSRMFCSFEAIRPCQPAGEPCSWWRSANEQASSSDHLPERYRLAVQALFAIFGEYVVFCHSFRRESVFFREGNPEIWVLKIVERRREASHIFDEAAKIVIRASFVGDTGVVIWRCHLVFSLLELKTTASWPWAIEAGTWLRGSAEC
jgi:hypothetical protein